MIGVAAVTVDVVAQQPFPDSLKQKIDHAPDLQKKYDAQREVYLFFERSGNHTESGRALGEMLSLAQQLKNDTLVIHVNYILGWFFLVRGDFKMALEFLLKTLRIAESVNINDHIISAHNSISVVYFDMKNYPEAVRYLRKALDICQLLEIKTKRNGWLATLYTNLSGNYNELNKIDSALKYAQLANQQTYELKTSERQSQQVAFLSTFGDIYEKLGDNELAETYYRRSIIMADSINSLQFAADNNHYYSKFLFKRERFNEAVSASLKGLHAAQTSDYKLAIIKAANILRNTYFKRNLRDSAYYYANMEANYRDTVYNEQNLNQVNDMTLAEQIRQHEEDQHLYDQKQKAKRNIQYSAIAIGIISFTILFLLFSRSIVANPKLIKILGIVGLLITFEFINLILHPYVAHITHESPFLMLLGMVLLAALLVPIHHYLEKRITQQLVQKNRKIKIAAAKKLLEKYDHEEGANKNNELRMNT